MAPDTGELDDAAITALRMFAEHADALHTIERCVTDHFLRHVPLDGLQVPLQSLSGARRWCRCASISDSSSETTGYFPMVRDGPYPAFAN